jgi:hypothetical protein
LVFETQEQAHQFDKSLVAVEDDFGIGDHYTNGKWEKHIPTIEESISEIDRQLKSIDMQGVTRHFENQIEASGTYDKLYDTTKNLINKKRELRIKRQELVEKL